MFKTNYKKYLVLILLCLCSATLFAQIELKNKVVDFNKGEGIESASVYIKNTTIGTVTNADGKFSLQVPKRHENDSLVVSSIGYSTYKIPISEYDADFEIFLEEEVASLEEVLIVGEPRPTTGNDIMVRAIERLPRNMPDSSYLQKGFLRHKERNKNEFKWLIESAITVYDSGFTVPTSKKFLKINVDQVRKSYDLRDIESLFKPKQEKTLR